ncbi:MAG: hypothetical protein PUD59_03130 [bacterium]|nr:hypothetical protein [bacterium]
MNERINFVLNEIGISKVRLSKYLGVSRQMLYNYLSYDNDKEWPREKLNKLFELLGVKNERELNKIKIDGNYIVEVESKLNDGVKATTEREVLNDLRGFNRKEQEILTDIINLLKEKLSEDKTKETYNAYTYLYHFLQSLDNSKELKYILAYVSKSMGFTNPNEFLFNPDQQFVFESILFSAMTIYNNGSASKLKLGESHKRFEEDIEQKKEETLSRTQELNTAKVQALKELGYTEINEGNAKEVLQKIVEIQSRKV